MHTKTSVSINMLSDDIHKRVLGFVPEAPTGRQREAMESNWQRHGLADAVDRNQVVNLPLPAWATDYKTMLKEATDKYGKPTEQRLWDFLDILERTKPTLPAHKPAYKHGWQQYTGDRWRASGAPTSDTAMVLDFETVEVSDGVWLPICCVVLTQETWYVWACDYDNMVTSIDFPGNQVIIGHNVGYDRAYLNPEYSYKDSGNRFYDTMSAWIAARGFTNQQRAVYAQAEKDDDFLAPAWVQETGKNGLADVYEFYTNKKISKGVRDLLVDEGMAYTRHNMSTVIWYAIQDVASTAEVFTHVFPEARRSQPHDASFTGQLLLGNTWLPLSTERFPGYYDRAEAKYLEIKKRVETRLVEVSQAVLEQPSEYQQIALDWTLAKTGKNKGEPKWYRDFKKNPSLHSRAAAILLGCTWRDEVIKWGTEQDDNGKLTGYWYTDSYGKLPHPEKRGKNLSDLFMQKMISTVEDGVLSAPGGVKDLLLDLISVINWVSLRKRVQSIRTESPHGYPVVLPQLVVTGTITRRCKDNIWQVVANPKKTRVGTELKSMIEAPAGYKLVGADVDSQELWLAACYGDMVLGFAGSSSLGLMIIMGNKDDGTDPHSVVAKDCQISRDLAKNIVYGCVPMYTEALTRQGWKTYDQLVLGEEILAYDPETQTNKWTPILNFTHHNSAMVYRSELSNGWTVESTPDHRWYGHKRVRLGNTRVYEPCVFRTGEIVTEHRILAAAKAEGGKGSELPARKYGTDWMSYVTSMTTEQRSAFLTGCIISDGCQAKDGTYMLTQKNGEHFEAMLLAAYLEGFKVSVSRHSNGVNHIRLSTRKHITGQRLQHTKLEDQAVWCPTTAFGTWVMRQGNVITITGNCVYGQGLKGTMDYLLKSNPLITQSEAKTTAFKLLNLFKGQRLTNYGNQYKGGFASDTFNEMEKVANSKCPTTPALKAKISLALRGIKDFATTRVNWAIQSSGADFRDIYVSYLRLFFDKMKIDGKLMMTIHDEMRTIVKEEHTKRAVYAVQLAHLYTRAFFIDAFGLDGIPASVAWHSSVDVDQVLRKSPKDPQVTPSQTEPIAPGQEIKPAQMLEWWS